MPKTAVALALCLVLSSLAAAAPDGRPTAGSTVRIISSSHQDIAWMNSPEACREYRDTHCITPALEMMAANPDYCFVMENMLNLMEYLERHPDRRDEILKYTREGRLEWGATFNQPYESLLTGEQLIRQTLFRPPLARSIISPAATPASTSIPMCRGGPCRCSRS